MTEIFEKLKDLQDTPLRAPDRARAGRHRRGSLHIGRKSAQRMAFKILDMKDEEVSELILISTPRS